MSHLDPKLRASLAPRIIDALKNSGQSYDAIAAELGVSPPYVRSLASRISRSTGGELRRKKPHRERRTVYGDA